ncbi:hypothetical protein E2C01_100522 [Portunus trituberculatus]|uniref:Uncharacterized protein n=1 Tax=Portunus trituberculatus TaxID=210409 RepID=A0A5B7K384_PORTR|nr:hypothetical protein [Portunus trituberculatus]
MPSSLSSTAPPHHTQAASLFPPRVMSPNRSLTPFHLRLPRWLRRPQGQVSGGPSLPAPPDPRPGPGMQQVPLVRSSSGYDTPALEGGCGDQTKIALSPPPASLLQYLPSPAEALKGAFFHPLFEEASRTPSPAGGDGTHNIIFHLQPFVHKYLLFLSFRGPLVLSPV